MKDFYTECHMCNNLAVAKVGFGHNKYQFSLYCMDHFDHMPSGEWINWRTNNNSFVKVGRLHFRKKSEIIR